jgi:hypothetical protein
MVYGPHKIKNIVVNSFRYSRGSSPAQYSILRFIGTNFAERFNPDAFSEAHQLSLNPIYYLYTNSKHHMQGGAAENEDSTKAMIAGESRSYHSALRRYAQTETYTEKDLDTLCSLLVGTDWHQMPHIRARGNRGDTGKPYFSNIVKRGFLHNPLGIEEFDVMYQAVASRISVLADPSHESAEFPPLRAKDLVEVIHAHHQHNPLDDALQFLSLLV